MSFEKLKECLCSAAGYTGADGEMKQQAGTCGTLTSIHYKQEASLEESASLEAQVTG